MDSIKYHDTSKCIIPLVCIGSLSISGFLYEIKNHYYYSKKTRHILNDSSIFLYYFGLGLSSYYSFNYLNYNLKYY